MNGDDRLRAAVRDVLRAWEALGSPTGLANLGRALRGLERAYEHSGGPGAAPVEEGGGKLEPAAVLGYGYRVLAGDPAGAVYALRWGAAGAAGAITGVIGPIERVPGGLHGAGGREVSEAAVRRQWDRRRAALEALPDPGSLPEWSGWEAGGGTDPGNAARVRWAREQSWRFAEPAGRGRQ